MEENVLTSVLIDVTNVLLITSEDSKSLDILKFIRMKDITILHPDDINEIKLGITYSCIIIFKVTVDIIRNIIRLCYKDTVLLFYYNENVPYEILYHKSWFKNSLITGHYYICNIEEERTNGSLPTIITCMYDIRSKEKSSVSPSIKSVSDYLKIGKSLMDLEVPMVIFTEESLKNEITSMRKEHKDLTKIEVIPLENLWGYAYLEKLAEVMKTYEIYNSNKSKDTSLYITLTNSKFDFIEQVMKSNPFNTEHYLWLDFGICHVAKNFNSIRRWVSNLPDKVRKLEIIPYTGKLEPRAYFKNIHHNVAAGVVSGNSIYLTTFCKLFKEYYLKILEDGWYQLDEAIMTMIDIAHPELSENYYGDYPTIISGYDYYNGNYPNIYSLCFRNMDIQLNIGTRDISMKILKYLEPYTLHNKEGIKDFIYYYLIIRYYVTEVKSIESYIIPYLQRCILDLKFLDKCKENLKFYNL